jgi:surface antigen
MPHVPAGLMGLKPCLPCSPGRGERDGSKTRRATLVAICATAVLFAAVSIMGASTAKASLTLGTWPGAGGPIAANQQYGYPYPNAPFCTAGPMICVADKWEFFQGQCTSWVAYRLNQLNGIAFNNSYRGQHWGNATDWGTAASNLGIAKDGTPAVGSVAWYAGHPGNNDGHVAYVEEVISSTEVVVSEMNVDFSNGFQVRDISTSNGWPTDFLHIADTGGGPPPTTNPPPAQAPVTATVSSSANPSSFGQAVTLTTTVAPETSNPNMPTGAVQMFDGATNIGSGSLAGGAFSVTTSSLSVGSHPITATYGGDSRFLSGSSSTFNQVVNKAATTTGLAASPPGSAGFGDPVTFSATVSVPPPGAGTPTGNITFTVDGTHVGQTTMTASLTASIATSALSPGSHVIGAGYNGDGNFLASSATLNYLVTCTNTITGTLPGAVVASGASTCILYAQIGGAIIVPGGTALAVEHSTVGGGIVTNSSHAVQICGSVIGGSVGVSGAHGIVIMGDPGDANCAVNTFKGAVVVRNNTQGIEVIGNKITGALITSNNSGPGPYSGDSSSVSGNS